MSAVKAAVQMASANTTAGISSWDVFHNQSDLPRDHLLHGFAKNQVDALCLELLTAFEIKRRARPEIHLNLPCRASGRRLWLDVCLHVVSSDMWKRKPGYTASKRTNLLVAD